MFGKLTEDQKKVLLIWFFLGVFIFGLVLFFVHKKIEEKKKDQVDKVYSVVTDYSRYYTVIGILDKYHSALSSRNYDSVYKMLNTNYIKNNDINEMNVQTKIKTYDIQTTVRGSLMCKKYLGKGFTSYYVSGSVIGVNEPKTIEDVYYEVLLDERHMLFSISEIDSPTFGGECHA